MPNIALCFLVYINFFIIYSKAGMVVIYLLLMHKLGLEKQMTCPMSYSCYIAQKAFRSRHSACWVKVSFRYSLPHVHSSRNPVTMYTPSTLHWHWPGVCWVDIALAVRNLVFSLLSLPLSLTNLVYSHSVNVLIFPGDQGSWVLHS